MKMSQYQGRSFMAKTAENDSLLKFSFLFSSELAFCGKEYQKSLYNCIFPG